MYAHERLTVLRRGIYALSLECQIQTYIEQSSQSAVIRRLLDHYGPSGNIVTHQLEVDMEMIIVSDQAYRLAANARIFHCMGVKLEDGSWSVLIESDMMAQIIRANRTDESVSDTILRLAS